MSFFEELDLITILEQNAKFVFSLEEEQAKKLLAVYMKIHDELLKKMQVFRGQFTGQMAGVTLYQVDASIRLLAQSLNENLESGVDEMLKTSIIHSAKEVEAFSEHFQGTKQVIPINAIRVALDTKNLLINKYQASIDAYSIDIRQKIADGLLEGLASRKTAQQMIKDMSSFWSNEEWRLRRIVRTELHNVHGQGKLAGMRNIREEFLPDLKKTLYHPLDHRTGDDSKWLIDNPLVVAIDAPFRYEWPRGSGKWRVFDAPPDRPNDRSIVIPYRKGWN